MNNRMYVHPATQANLELLAARGVTVIAPGEGELASHGEHGVGRLAEPAELLAACESLLAPRERPSPSAAWLGRPRAGHRRRHARADRQRALHRQPLLGPDGLRAGRAGRRAAAPRSRWSPPTSRCRRRPGVRLIAVATAAELGAACEREFEACDVLLMAAAVADFRPRAPADTKLKKDRGAPQLELEPTEDVLSALAARRRPGQVLVGFAAEHGDEARRLRARQARAQGPRRVVVNDISQPGIGFDADRQRGDDRVAGGRRAPTGGPGQEGAVAARVLDEVEQLRARKESSDRAVRADPDRAARV